MIGVSIYSQREIHLVSCVRLLRRDLAIRGIEMLIMKIRSRL